MNRRLVIVITAIVLLAGWVAWAVTWTFDGAVMALKGGRYESAKPKLELLASAGHAQAQRLLGEMYAYGWGVPRNRDEAVTWFRRAAYRGEGLKDPAAYAAYYVARSFSEGLGVQKDPVEAAWWDRFAQNGGYSTSP